MLLPNLAKYGNLLYQFKLASLLLVVLFAICPSISNATEQPIDSLPALQSEIRAEAAVSNLPEDYFDLEQKKIFRWNDQTRTILVYIADGSYLSGWRPENPQLVKAAFAEWERAMGGRFHFIYMPDERGSDIQVKWETRIAEDQHGEAIGINECMTWGKYISRNNITLALYDPSGTLVSSPLLQSTALHEIGHALGLRVHSNDSNDVMYYQAHAESSDIVQHLTSRDINTLKKVYMSRPDYVTPEGYRLSNFDSFKKKHGGRSFSILWVPIPGVPVPVPVPLPF